MKNRNFKIVIWASILVLVIVLWNNVQARTLIPKTTQVGTNLSAVQIGLVYHLFDANNQDLGIFLGNNQYKQVIVPNLNLVTYIDDDTTNPTVDYYTNNNLVSVEFTGLNCTGDKFTSNYNKHIILMHGQDGNYYKYVAGTPLVNRIALSYYENGACQNYSIPPGGNDSYLIEQVALPITNPITLPLHLELK